jgi:phosphatidylinositol glycan class T
MKGSTTLAVVLLGLIGAVNALSDRFDEQLTLRPLADGRLHTLFSFVLQSGQSQDDSTSVPIYSTVPRSLIHLAKASNAQEIHLAINAGRWDYQKWGEPGAEEMVGNGAEVWAKLRRDESLSYEERGSK